MSDTATGKKRTPTWWLMAVCTSICFGIVAGYSLRFAQDFRKSNQHVRVDESWVTASRNCWNGLSALHDIAISGNLADPVRFRAAFPGYARMTDDQIIKLVQSPQASAPIPDQGLFLGWTSIRVPVKQEAVDYGAIAKSLGNDGKSPPADMLCNVSDGLPAGFSPN